jgi:peptide/nickel transport system substrate-binding protein
MWLRVLVLLGLVGAGLAPRAGQAQRAENALTWGFTSEIETMDPYATAKRTAQLVIRNVLETLVYRDPVSGEAKPLLATAWHWVDDKTLELSLLHDVTFQDGQPFDADDVVYTVTQVKRTDVPVSFAEADYGYIDHAEKIDAYTVRLDLKAPTPSAVDRLTQTLFILPHGAHAKLGAQAFARAPIGTGPYRVDSFEPGRRLVLARYAAYHPVGWGKPRLDRINVVTIPDPQTQVAELTRGRVDFLWSIGPDQVQQLQGAAGVKTVTGGSTSIYFLSLDAAGRSGANPMQDMNVRLAIATAIDRAAISQVLQGGSSVVIDAACHPKQFGCPTDVEKHPYDVAKAKALMAASHYPNGFTTSIAAFTDGGPVAEAVLGDLREIGITGKVDLRETSAWIKDFFAGHQQASIVPWPSSGVYDVSALVPLFFMGQPGDYTRDDEIAGWFRTAGSITDPTERQRLYRLGFQKIAREAYVVPLMTSVTSYGFRDALDFTAPADGYPLIAMAGWR